MDFFFFTVIILYCEWGGKKVVFLLNNIHGVNISKKKNGRPEMKL